MSLSLLFILQVIDVFTKNLIVIFLFSIYLWVPGLLILEILFSSSRRRLKDSIIYSPLLTISVFSIIYFVLSKLSIAFKPNYYLIVTLILLLIWLAIKNQYYISFLKSFKMKLCNLLCRVFVPDAHRTPKISIQVLMQSILSSVAIKLDKKLLLYLFLPTLVLFIIQIVAFWGSTLLLGDDSQYHYSYIVNLDQTGLLLNTYYPFAMHIIISIFHKLTGFPITQLLLMCSITIVCFMPPVIYSFSLRIIKDKRIAMFSSLLVPLFSFFPTRPYLWGGFPFLWSLVLMWSYCDIFIDSLDTPKISKFFITIIMGCGLLFLHSPEIATVFIVIFLYLILNRKLLLKWETWFLGLGQVVAFLIIYFVWPMKKQLYSYPRLVESDSFLGMVKDFLWYSLNYFTSFSNYLMIGLFMIGIVVLVIKLRQGALVKSWTYLLLYFLVMSIFYVDIIFFNKFSFIYSLFYPWADKFRFLEFTIFPVCLIASYGLDLIIKYLHKYKYKREEVFLRFIFILGYIIPILMISFILRGSLLLDRTPPKNLNKVIDYLNENNISSISIINDYYQPSLEYLDYRPADFMAWLGILTPNQVTFPYVERDPFTSEAYKDKKYLLDSLKILSMDVKAQKISSKYNISYVVWSGKLQGGRPHYLNYKDLVNNSSLVKVFETPECVESSDNKECITLFKINLND